MIAQQDRRQKMARSTIQEKLSGKTTLNLPQVLAIVDALREYAELHNAPLPNSDTDRELWRERVAISSRQADANHPRMITPAKQEETVPIEWNFEPLRQAQMDDLVQLASDNRWRPVADWLPKLLRAMTQAEMTTTDFLKKAAEDTPQGVVNTVKALEEEFPYKDESDFAWGVTRSQENKDTVGKLLAFAARRHGNSASPAIVVSLRRSGLSHHVKSYLAQVGMWFLAPDIERAMEHLKTAALGKDAEYLLMSIGKHRRPDRILEIVQYLQAQWMASEANKVLRGIGSGNMHRLQVAVNDFRKHEATDDMLREIARGIESGKHEEYAQYFDAEGDRDFANMIADAESEPPF
ncbi:hypothetical protein ACIP3D_29720 [Streptomyces longwoodensis]|uniref:hypothetical protein n=1 Tax=Streptomyces longwoodensis TaxID=68231 RepID=UPI00381E8AC6